MQKSLPVLAVRNLFAHCPAYRQEMSSHTNAHKPSQQFPGNSMTKGKPKVATGEKAELVHF